MFEVGSSKKSSKIFIKHIQNTQFWDLKVSVLVKHFFPSISKFQEFKFFFFFPSLLSIRNISIKEDFIFASSLKNKVSYSGESNFQKQNFAYVILRKAMCRWKYWVGNWQEIGLW